MRDRIELTVFIRCAPGGEEEMRSQLRSLMAEAVNEPGCLEFRFFERHQISDEFMLWETFQTTDALRLHLQADYTKAFFSTGLVARTEVTEQQRSD